MLPMISRVRRWPLVVMAFAVIIAATAQTASNTVPSTKVVDNSNAIGANNLKPTECGSITLTTKVTGSGTINGTSAAELLTGSTVADTISGAGGDDCLLGGAGDDNLNGGTGIDVCIGGPGTDTFNSSCETKIQ